MPSTLKKIFHFSHIILITAVFLLPQGCAGASWGEGGSAARSYYYFIKANYKEVERKDDEALTNMAKAAEESSASYYLKLETARLHSRMGNNEKAMEYVKQAIASDPNAIEGRLFAGWLAGIEENWGEAEEQYQAALKIDPVNVEAISYLGALYAESGKLKEAENTFKKLTVVDPSYLSFYYLGRFYNSINRSKDAIKAFEAAVKLNPEFSGGYTELAILYEKTGNLKAAERTYRTMINAKPNNSNMAKARLARLLLIAGRKAEAEKILKDVDGRKLDSGQTQLQIGLIYLDQNLYKEAIAEFQAILASSPDNHQARYLLATAYLESGNSKSGNSVKARELLMKIPPSSNLYEDARLLLASTSSKKAPIRLQESLVIINDALIKRPDSQRLTAAKAMIYEELGNIDRAISILTEAVRKFPDSAEMQFRLAVAEENKGNKTAVINALKAAIKLNPNHADALNHLAYTWAERKENLKEALLMAEKANKLKPNNGYILDTVGWIHFLLGDLHKALIYIEKAVPLSDNNHVVLEHLGDIYLKMGHKQQALQCYRDASANNPDNLEELNAKIKKIEE